MFLKSPPQDAATIAALDYPYDVETIVRKRSAIKRALMARNGATPPIRFAILGGSTTQELKSTLELFLLRDGFAPTFYESDFNRFFEEAMFGSDELTDFKPDLVYLHVGPWNLTSFPEVGESPEAAQTKLDRVVLEYANMWQRLHERHSCTVIQSNFPLLPWRVFGNFDSTLPSGKTHFINRLNLELATRAQGHSHILINDLNYLSATFGLDRWYNWEQWYAYRIGESALAQVAIPGNLATLVRASRGRSRKCLVLDLDNTLWGGVIGDDGVEGIRMGPETPEGETFREFQTFSSDLNRRGILLAACSKNEKAIAEQGLAHRDSVLSRDSFAAFRANWDVKSKNVHDITAELNIGVESLVFVDDNPMERLEVRQSHPSVAVPEVGNDVIRFATLLDRSGFFDSAVLSSEDLARAELYRTENQRASLLETSTDYDAFLASLDMEAEIAPFSAMYLERITQLVNKTNQFNVTLQRCTSAQISDMASSPEHITLYGRLQDRFGDHGLISVVVARVVDERAHVLLWLMSCRVLKRNMEQAMCRKLREAARRFGCRDIIGYYVPTVRNGMVSDLYERLGFQLLPAMPNEAPAGTKTAWVHSLGTSADAEPLHIRFVEPK